MSYILIWIYNWYYIYLIFFSFNVKEQSKMFNIILHFTWRKTLVSETMDHLLLKIKMISKNVLFLLVEARTLYYCLTVVNLELVALYLQEICIYRRSYLAEKGTIYNFLWSILALYLHGCFSLYFTQDSGTADFSRYTIQSLNHFCFEEIRKYEIFNVKNDFEEESVVETIGKLVCPNDCSSNGVCNRGVWFI